MISSICLFCGSSPGNRPEYIQAAIDFGKTLAERGQTLVYGGGNVGLMGVAADAALAAGGKVVGVIPRLLMDKEVGHTDLTKLHVVESMHERKALMADLSDAFVALPGAFGTLDEVFEALTWRQLGIIDKPVGMLNVAGFYTPLFKWLDTVVEAQFLRAENRSMLIESETIPDLLDRLARAPKTHFDKWQDRTPPPPR